MKKLKKLSPGTGKIATPAKYKEKYQPIYEIVMRLEVGDPKLKGMRSTDVSIEEIRKALDKQHPFLVHVVYTVMRARIERGSKWEDFSSGFLFLLDSIDNVHLGFIDAFPKDKEISVKHLIHLFEKKEQIAKLEDFEGNFVILRTTKSNYCIEFPKLYPKGDFMGQYNKIVEMKGPIYTSVKEPKRRGGISSFNVSRPISGKLSLASKPPKIKQLKQLGEIEAKKIKEDLSEEWKTYLRKTVGLKVLQPKRSEGIKNLKLIDDALRGYTVLMKEMNCLLDGKSFKPPGEGSRNDKEFRAALEKTRIKEMLETLGGGF